MSESEAPKSPPAHVRHGKKIQIIAVASVIFWLILSDGYDPRLGPVTSFYYSMTVHDSKWSCRCPKGEMCMFDSQLTDCTNIQIYTKHLVLLSIFVFMYGFLIQRGLSSDPIPRLRMWASRIKQRE